MRHQCGSARGTTLTESVRGTLPAPSARRQRRRTLLWMGFTVLTVIIAACIPLLYTPRYYFLGDTQIGAFGQWYHLGEKLRSGELDSVSASRSADHSVSWPATDPFDTPNYMTDCSGDLQFDWC